MSFGLFLFFSHGRSQPFFIFHLNSFFGFVLLCKTFLWNACSGNISRSCDALSKSSSAIAVGNTTVFFQKKQIWSLSPACTILWSSSNEWIFASVGILQHEFPLQIPLSSQRSCNTLALDLSNRGSLRPFKRIPVQLFWRTIRLCFVLEFLLGTLDSEQVKRSVFQLHHQKLIASFSLCLCFGFIYFGAVRNWETQIVTRAHNMLHMESAHTRSRQKDCLLVIGRSVVLQRKKLELGAAVVMWKEKKTEQVWSIECFCEKTVSSTSPTNAVASSAWKSKQQNETLLLNKCIHELDWSPRDNFHLCSDLFLDGVGIQPNECAKNLALCWSIVQRSLHTCLRISERFFCEPVVLASNIRAKTTRLVKIQRMSHD